LSVAISIRLISDNPSQIAGISLLQLYCIQIRSVERAIFAARALSVGCMRERVDCIAIDDSCDNAHAIENIHTPSSKVSDIRAGDTSNIGRRIQDNLKLGQLAPNLAMHGTCLLPHALGKLGRVLLLQPPETHPECASYIALFGVGVVLAPYIMSIQS